MGFIEVFGLALGLIAFGTVMALFWRVLNKIFRAIEHHHDSDSAKMKKQIFKGALRLDGFAFFRC